MVKDQDEVPGCCSQPVATWDGRWECATCGTAWPWQGEACVPYCERETKPHTGACLQRNPRA